MDVEGGVTALQREIDRKGQAFFLHNRVETIDETAERLRGLLPEVRFEVAHGQLEEKVLEQRMMSFLRRESDVLVCTSIIESGLDIPQANTLVVERSDTFGLAQLYQIRGRVGRSRERAYAYLLYPSAATLTGEAAQRLAALSDYTELGAGVHIAMRDLEIRGAGNLLGAEQSGHVAALGFELYMQMLDEAVRARMQEGTPVDESEPVRLDVNVDAYVPADYVPYEQAKVDVHRRMAARATWPSSSSCARSSTTASGRCPTPSPTSRPAEGPHQAGPGRRAHGVVPGRPARGDADRDGLDAGQGAARGASPRRCTSSAARSCWCGCPATRASVSPPWCGGRRAAGDALT